MTNKGERERGGAELPLFYGGTVALQPIGEGEGGGEGKVKGMEDFSFSNFQPSLGAERVCKGGKYWNLI